MPGENLFTLRCEILFALTNAYTAEANEAFPDPLIFKALNQAEAKIKQRKTFAMDSDATADLVSGSREIDYPVEILGDRISRVAVKNASGDWVDLERRDFRELENEASTSMGEPCKFAVSDYGRSIILSPWPNRTAADSVRFSYYLNPQPLSRIWQQQAITASTTAGSPTVTLSAPFDDSLVASGDEFALMADAYTVPETWFKILSVDSVAGTLTLDSNFPTTTSASLFITSEVPYTMQRLPGRLNPIMMQFATGYIYQATSPQAAANWMIQATQMLDAETRDETGLKSTGSQPSRNTYFLNRGR